MLKEFSSLYSLTSIFKIIKPINKKKENEFFNNRIYVWIRRKGKLFNQKSIDYIDCT